MDRLLILSVLCIVAIAKAIGADYDTNPVCGIYTSTDGGAKIEIVPFSEMKDPLPQEYKVKYSLTPQYVILVGDNPTPTLQPGQAMGWLAPLAKKGAYDAIIMTNVKDGILCAPHRFVLELNDEGSILSMIEIKHHVRLDPLRFLPYLFHGVSLKGTLKMEDNRDKIVEGFLKISPRPATPTTPRIL